MSSRSRSGERKQRGGARKRSSSSSPRRSIKIISVDSSSDDDDGDAGYEKETIVRRVPAKIGRSQPTTTLRTKDDNGGDDDNDRKMPAIGASTSDQLRRALLGASSSDNSDGEETVERRRYHRRKRRRIATSVRARKSIHRTSPHKTPAAPHPKVVGDSDSSRPSTPSSDVTTFPSDDWLKSHCWDCHVRLRETGGHPCLYALHVHPLLNVPVCSVCAEDAAYCLQQQSTTNESNNQDDLDCCSGCGVDGVALYLCDLCPHGFCSKCVQQAHGGGERGKRQEETLQKDETASWACMACYPPDALSRIQLSVVTDSGGPEGEGEENADELLENLQRVEASLLECDNQDRADQRAAAEQRIRTELQRESAMATDLEEIVQRELQVFEQKWDAHHARLSDRKTDLLEKLNRLGVSDKDFYDQYQKEATSTFEEQGDWVKRAEKEIEERYRQQEEERKNNESEDDSASSNDEEDQAEAKALMEVEDLTTEEEFKDKLKKMRKRRTLVPSKAQVREAIRNDAETLEDYRVKVEEIREADDDKAAEEEEKFVSSRGRGGVVIRRDVVHAIKKRAPRQKRTRVIQRLPVRRKPSKQKIGSTSPSPGKFTSPTNTLAARPRSATKATERNSTRKSLILEVARKRAYLEGDDFGPSTLELHSDSGKRVTIAKPLVDVLKDHQVDGIKFMWRTTFSDLVASDKGAKSSGGCILAHHMGLGKTLQVIALLHAAINHPSLRSMQGGQKRLIRRVLLLVPPNTLVNWENEFEMWTSNLADGFNVYNLHESSSLGRLRVVKHWYANGGVLLMGPTMFARNVANLKEELETFLQDPGPDVVVLDEAHTMLKSKDSQIGKALAGIRTLRRVVMTGTPVQNNLLEYYSMASWVRPGCLGSQAAFSKFFVKPIMAGMMSDATSEEVAVQVQKTRELFSVLSAFTQRKNNKILTNDLPPLQQVVLYVRQSKMQARLYSAFKKQNRILHRKMGLFEHYQTLKPIHNHPYGRLIARETADKKRPHGPRKPPHREPISYQKNGQPTSEASVAMKQEGDFQPSTQSANQSTSSPVVIELLSSDSEEEEEVSPPSRSSSEPSEDAWLKALKQDPNPKRVQHGKKIYLLLQILAQAQRLGDKVIVFSCCLRTLDFIEILLQSHDWGKYIFNAHELEPGIKAGGWKKNLDYLRIDGAVKPSERGELIEKFQNERSKAFLISIEAGGIGVNLTVANRVVILESHWNPSLMNQALHRCYRYNQTKPVFGYRFVTEGSMEEKIYARSVNKSGLAERVVDFRFPQRYFTCHQLNELQDNDTWVQCDRCEKWRMLILENETELPEHWDCSMNRDPYNNRCEIEEKSTEWYTKMQPKIIDLLTSKNSGGAGLEPLVAGDDLDMDDEAAEQRKRELITKDEILVRLGLLQHGSSKKQKGVVRPVDVVSKIRFHDSFLAESKTDLEIEASHLGTLQARALEEQRKTVAGEGLGPTIAQQNDIGDNAMGNMAPPSLSSRPLPPPTHHSQAISKNKIPPPPPVVVQEKTGEQHVQNRSNASQDPPARMQSSLGAKAAAKQDDANETQKTVRSLSESTPKRQADPLDEQRKKPPHNARKQVANSAWQKSPEHRDPTARYLKQDQTPKPRQAVARPDATLAKRGSSEAPIMLDSDTDDST